MFYTLIANMVLGKVRALGIYFDTLNENNLPVFSGGDLVSGRVVVDVTGDVRVKSLNIVARGVAKVRWTESRNGGAHTAYTQNYTEEVEYLHHYDTLIGEERGEFRALLGREGGGGGGGGEGALLVPNCCRSA